ncbi:DUF2790 domain-containing protein [Pseudomonas sp. UBA1879]|jgi:hypothetical protein|uniref:DUF2790 domain-containing protein n=1 Tax=Pseudomonas sp. UBA1879 TaxID=1947305 RepID=UPI0025F33533|nr:DUF2790 domain-containing protein [Pseudomonas sp. UBA1879]
MKAALVVMALCGFSALAMAEESGAKVAAHEQRTQQQVEHYSYSTKLDIAKVISVGEVPNVCRVVPQHMTYEDSHGQRHVMEYMVMGNGCSNG